MFHFASFMTLFEQAVSNIADSGEVLLMGDFNVDPVNSASHV
jgi:endonuclease/exonuclease/phosphatase family metal-dependent hydrolase